MNSILELANEKFYSGANKFSDNKDKIVEACIERMNKKILSFSEMGFDSIGFDYGQILDTCYEYGIMKEDYIHFTSEQISSVIVEVGEHYKKEGFNIQYYTGRIFNKPTEPPYIEVFIRWGESAKRHEGLNK